jgi:NhaP-type Na+/H+ or K+/H+ antiporter
MIMDVTGTNYGQQIKLNDSYANTSRLLESLSADSIFPGKRNETDGLFGFLYLIGLSVVLLLGFKVTRVWRIHHIPESGIAIIVGVIVSLTTHALGHNDIANNFDPSTFFFFLLPPLIFQAGYSQDRVPFFSNWFAISIFANLGTVISILVFGYCLFWLGLAHVSLPLSVMECLAFGSLISATDPVATLSVFADLNVDPALNAIIYGASAVDDAIALILYDAFHAHIVGEYSVLQVSLGVIFFLIVNLVASIVIGGLLGGLFAWIMKVNKLNDSKKVTVCLSYCLVYISYFACSALQVSGLISCMFAAISLRYCLEVGEVLSESGFDALSLALGSISCFVENFVFFCIGMSAVTMTYAKFHNLDGYFVCWCLLLAVVSRLVQVYQLSYITNTFNGVNKAHCGFGEQGGAVHPDSEGDEDIDIEGRNGVKEKVIHINKPAYISLNSQHMIMLAGLRGPIAYAMALTYPPETGNADNIYFATTAIVLSNILVIGSISKSALSFLRIEHGVEKECVVVNPVLRTALCTDSAFAHENPYVSGVSNCSVHSAGGRKTADDMEKDPEGYDHDIEAAEHKARNGPGNRDYKHSFSDVRGRTRQGDEDDPATDTSTNKKDDRTAVSAKEQADSDFIASVMNTNRSRYKDLDKKRESYHNDRKIESKRVALSADAEVDQVARVSHVEQRGGSRFLRWFEYFERKVVFRIFVDAKKQSD